MAELRITDTNSANDSRGRAFGLEGNDFIYVLVALVGAMGLYVVCTAILRFHVAPALLLAAPVFLAPAAWVVFLRHNKPSGYAAVAHSTLNEGARVTEKKPAIAASQIQTWADLPLAYPKVPRFGLGDKYRTVAVYELLHEGGGSVPFERFRRAYWLLTEPARLQTEAAKHFSPALAQQWNSSFVESLPATGFVSYLGDAYKAGELDLFRGSGGLMIRTLKTPSYIPEHVVFDARLALSVADLWPDPPDRRPYGA